MISKNKPRIGMLWGDFPWTEKVMKLGKLWSMGRVARDTTKALNDIGEVIPYRPPNNKKDEPEVMEKFLRGIDILWADMYPSSALALSLRDELDLPCSTILFAGGVLPKGAEAMLFSWNNQLRSDDGILFSCEADKEIWRRLVDWSTLKEWVVPLSVDETVFYPRDAKNRSDIRMKYGFPMNSPLLLYVGRINIQKNLHTLFQMFAEVYNQIPDAYLCIVGEEDDIVFGEFGVRNTGYVQKLQTIAKEYGVQNRIKFVGSLFGEDLARMYSASDMVINVGFYHRENFGLSQAEAAACGVPVVCTEWGGFKDIVEDGKTGYFIDTIITKNGIRVNWKDGSKKIITLLQNSELHQKIGSRAATYALEQFSVRALGQNLSDVIGEVLPLRQERVDLLSTPPYKPSEFAIKYDNHKKECGWYSSNNEYFSWYPPMFQGKDYKLYETLMQSYATGLVQDGNPNDIKEDWIPYFPSPVKLDSIQFLIINEDLIWVHRKFLTSSEWEIVKLVNGTNTIEDIVASSKCDNTICISVLWSMHLEGFLLFY
jgi:glycosyltransferase involved in cell wall biosynthesis